MASASRARITHQSSTIYDLYPLSLRALWTDTSIPCTRPTSHSIEDPTHQRMNADDDNFYSNLHNTSSSMGSIIDLNDGMVQRTSAPARPTPLCSTFGKFHSEVFETKERSKVLSALRHRGKAAKSASSMKPHAPMRPLAPSTFTADDILRAGTLTKQGSWRRNWKTRFFILRSDYPSLCYFRSEENLELLGEIPITEDTIVLDRSGGGHAPFRFQIRSDAYTLLLEAESRETQLCWIESCQELADAIRASKFSVNIGSCDGRRSSLLRGTSKRVDLGEASVSSQHWDETTNNNSVGDETETCARRPQRVTASSATSSTSQENGTPQRLYDLSISVLLGRRSKLTRLVEQLSSAEKEKDRTGCFVAISGYVRSAKSYVELGATDTVKLTTLVAACSTVGDEMAVPFSIILTTELECYDHLRLTLCKSQLSQSPGNSHGTFGIGHCQVDDPFLGSTPCMILITERSTTNVTKEYAPVTNLPLPRQNKEPGVQIASGNGTRSSFSRTVDSETVQLVVQAFRSVPPQSVLPTTGIDMANAKYLVPSTLAPGRETTGRMATLSHIELPSGMRGSDVRTFMENDTFLSGIGIMGTLNEAPSGNLRFVAVDEILRVPRSTFALPIAYLDFLEEQALERSRWLQKRVHSKTLHPREIERYTVELDFLRRKQEEYLKQRQFFIQQEKRLLDEQKEGKFFLAAKRASMISVSQERDAVAAAVAANASIAGVAIPPGAGCNDAVAPFKRSTYKNLNLWQFLPTNMQDQFLCTYKPPPSSKSSPSRSSRPFVWHTMTMGCPAAHTKGFANGGYPASLPVLTVHPTGSTTEESSLDPKYEGDSHSPTSPASLTRPSSNHTPATTPSASEDDSLAALKLRLELQDRLTVIGSQILSATAACILASLDLALSGSALHQAQLDRAPTFGFLMNFESLLSTQGKEYGMLEDFAAGVRWLRNVFIQFRRHATTGTFFSLRKYTPPNSNTNDNNCLVLTMGLAERHMAILPSSLVAGDATVHVRAVLFSQGVNEKQSLVHAYKSSAVKLQERVNRDNLVELKRIYALYRDLRVKESEATEEEAAARGMDRHDLHALEELLVQIEHHICSPTSQYKKNVALLMDSSDFCRALGAARVTCCKSGKDRTAMSVTLEQTRLLCAELQAAQGAALCANMRLYGVRRRNVFMNTKADKFAFNEMQRKMLPECYKPPAGTYKSGKT